MIGLYVIRIGQQPTVVDLYTIAVWVSTPDMFLMGVVGVIFLCGFINNKLMNVNDVLIDMHAY